MGEAKTRRMAGRFPVPSARKPAAFHQSGRVSGGNSSGNRRAVAFEAGGPLRDAKHCRSETVAKANGLSHLLKIGGRNIAERDGNAMGAVPNARWISGAPPSNIETRRSHFDEGGENIMGVENSSSSKNQLAMMPQSTGPGRESKLPKPEVSTKPNSPHVPKPNGENQHTGAGDSKGPGSFPPPINSTPPSNLESAPRTFVQKIWHTPANGPRYSVWTPHPEAKEFPIEGVRQTFNELVPWSVFGGFIAVSNHEDYARYSPLVLLAFMVLAGGVRYFLSWDPKTRHTEWVQVVFAAVFMGLGGFAVAGLPGWVPDAGLRYGAWVAVIGGSIAVSALIESEKRTRAALERAEQRKADSHPDGQQVSPLEADAKQMIA